ncbi:MAG: hypothetical protein Q4D38_10150 [Planctomycetia bacterium]|nr:hypothetical protein [Planctomycetia bacterium]
MLRRILSFTLFLLAGFSSAVANVGIFDGGGSNVVMTTNAEIQMVWEEIDMTLKRSPFRVDESGSCSDRMSYRCRFLLRNLSEKEETIQVGFPLHTNYVRSSEPPNSMAMQVRYSFFAGANDETYPVRFVAEDEEKKFRDVFLWNMTFAPKEEIELWVCYEMGGYFGLASLYKDDAAWDEETSPSYHSSLEFALAQSFIYVTETGNCWAGEIERATFRIHQLKNFESYLDKRGAVEPYDEKLPEPDFYWNTNGFRLRILEPSEKEWTTVGEGAGSFWELKYEPFVPKKTISLSYYFTNIPRTAEDYDHFLEYCRQYKKKEVQKWKGYLEEYPNTADLVEEKIAEIEKIPDIDAAEEKICADLILEFYGVKTNNKNAERILPNFIWHPVSEPKEMDEGLKSALEKSSRGGG